MDDSSAIRLAMFSLLGTVVGSIIGGGAVVGSQYMQGQRELNIACQTTFTKQEELLRQRAEIFLVAVSEQISFFRQNNQFEVSKAREKLGEVQKAAFSLSAYASPDLSIKSIAVVTAIDAALDPMQSSDIRSSASRVQEALSSWEISFKLETQALLERRAQCR
jgi:hypothetical protein